MYIQQYEHELGPPWKNQDLWIKVSYPFFHADRIKTPTLFMCGEKDFNVPLLGSEQMYQALRSLGVETELVIYPEPVPRHHDAELQEGSARALPGVVRQVPEDNGEEHELTAFGFVDIRANHVLGDRVRIVREPFVVERRRVGISLLG